VTEIEIGFILYCYNFAIGLIGFGLFLWWWKSVGEASFVYKCFTFILIAWSFQNGIASRSRYLYLTGQYEDFHEYLHTDLWDFRTVPMTVLITVILISMIFRVRKAIKNERNVK
jgi:hypothetical protein